MTVEQTTLDGTAVTISNGKQLTPRQQLAYNLVRAAERGVDTDEVGALLHERKGKHPADARCRFCGDEGRAVLTSVALKPLVTRRRATGRWHPRSPAAATHPASGVIATSEPDPRLNPFANIDEDS